MDRALIDRLLDRLSLTRMSSAGDAGLCVTSLPLPRGGPSDLGFRGVSTYAKPLGQWWNESRPMPLRLLLAADSGGEAPSELKIGPRGANPPSTASPTARAELFAQSDDPELHWERHAFTIEWNGRRISLAMGMRVKGEVHWWEHGRLVTLSRSETCCEVEMAGSIPHVLFTGDDLRAHPGYSYPLLHVHHWLSGKIYARLHSNGVCEIFAHHINSKYVDDGKTLHDAVPVVGFRATESAGDSVPFGAWDGQQKEATISGVRIDLTDVSHMVSPRQPGRFDRDGEFIVWQPYTGMELYGGLFPKERTGDPFICRAEQHVIPRGMSRTLRFSLSLNPRRSPMVARYLAPSWWYGLCEELAPAPLLPVSDRFDEALRSCQHFLREHMVQNGFEDGSLPRGTKGETLEGRNEPGWEGEAGGSGLMLAYRTGEAQDYDYGLRAAYCFTNLYLDHAAKMARMHGMGPDAVNLPHGRVHAAVYAYLETGDRFCLDIAKSVVDNTYWAHKNSWPRLAVGRDACFVRGAMLLHRFFDDARALEIARDTIRDVAESQHPDGYFGDQGGGSGLHGWGGYVVKPWMGLMAVGGALDYLSLYPDDFPEALACVRKFADWLMRERFDHGEGVVGWSYQHLFNGGREFRVAQTGQRQTLPTPSLWHMDYFARLMTFCALRFGDPAYFEAWAESYDGTTKERVGDHGFAQSVQYIPWVQAMAWRAKLDAKGKVVAHPVPLGPRAPREGTVLGPDGPVAVRRSSATPVTTPTV